MKLMVAVGAIWVVGTAVVHALKSPDGWALIAIPAGVIVLIIRLMAGAKKRKLDYLMGKYGDETIAAKIYHHQIWQGQTAE